MNLKKKIESANTLPNFVFRIDPNWDAICENGQKLYPLGDRGQVFNSRVESTQFKLDIVPVFFIGIVNIFILWANDKEIIKGTIFSPIFS